jgi:Kef-type K+ transport system membrane component KefB
MAAPFALGAALGWVLHRHTALFPAGVAAHHAMLFLGASMCITAFPMLARIIHFKGLSGSVMGTVAISAGAIDDATAWCLLAVVLASANQAPGQALLVIGGGVAFAALALGPLRLLLARLARHLTVGGALTEAGLALALVLMALGAWWTDRIGLHAVFGAFVMGAAMPRGMVTRDLVARIQPLTVALLLPLFFTYSGLNTRLGLLDSAALWLWCAAVLAVAVLGKGGGCWLAARLSGLGHREALGIGTLMNSRGLMELIIINIGLQHGIISPAIFAMLVIMAVITTLMASPIFDRLQHGDPPPLAGGLRPPHP